jgi:hypothetical protein
MEALAGGLRTEDDEPDCHGQHSRHPSAGQTEAARHRQTARSWRLDSRSQARRGLDLGCGGPHELDCPLLLGKPIGKLRRLRDLCLERSPTRRRERPVRERGELDDLLTGVIVLSTASYGHGSTHGNAERAKAWRSGARKKAKRVVTSSRTPFSPGLFPEAA